MIDCRRYFLLIPIVIDYTPELLIVFRNKKVNKSPMETTSAILEKERKI